MLTQRDFCILQNQKDQPPPRPTFSTVNSRSLPITRSAVCNSSLSVLHVNTNGGNQDHVGPGRTRDGSGPQGTRTPRTTRPRRQWRGPSLPPSSSPVDGVLSLPGLSRSRSDPGRRQVVRPGRSDQGGLRLLARSRTGGSGARTDAEAGARAEAGRGRGTRSWGFVERSAGPGPGPGAGAVRGPGATAAWAHR